uniref:Uncharacterized protein n=1 Tax=Arundo donax TaxID=35708 RepID=A0A0A9B675_ARUDO
MIEEMMIIPEAYVNCIIPSVNFLLAQAIDYLVNCDTDM